MLLGHYLSRSNRSIGGRLPHRASISYERCVLSTLSAIQELVFKKWSVHETEDIHLSGNHVGELAVYIADPIELCNFAYLLAKVAIGGSNETFQNKFLSWWHNRLSLKIRQYCLQQ